MKKVFSILALVTMLGAAQLSHAIGVGLEFGFNGIPDVGLTLKMGNFPVVDLTARFDAGGIGIGALVDYWVINKNLVSFIDWYLGIGGYATLQLGNNSGLWAGFRLPVLGLQFWPIGKQFEIFVEGAWAPSIISPSGVGLGWQGFQSGIGFRIHL